jgi:hypothetical protein
MRRVTLSLVVLAVVGLAASTALAGTSSPKVSLQLGPTLVAHHGSPGYGHGHRSYRYGHHPRPYHPYRPGGPVIVRPIVPPPPAVIYPYPSYDRYQPYYYGPSGGIHYRGPGFGISIGF